NTFMNNLELNFAYKVRHALNENLDNLPASTTDRLASARKAALSRKKQDNPLRALTTRQQTVFAGGAGKHLGNSFSWLGRIGIALPLLVLVVGLIGDRKSTRLNSSHVSISYAVFCLKKKITINRI